MTQNRTHTCGELRLSDAGKTVRIVGWMENVRVVGANFAFVVVRDFYGTTQVVVETEDMMNVVKSINKESTIAVEHGPGAGRQEPQAAHRRDRDRPHQDRDPGPLPLQRAAL